MRLFSGGATGIIGRLVRPKAETAVNTLDRLILDTYRGISTSAGVSVTPDTAMRVGAVYSCVLVLAQSIAQLPLHLYKRNGREKERVLDHPAIALMQRPNPWMTAFDFKQLAMVHLALRGNSYWLKVKAGRNGDIQELIPIAPDRIVGVQQDEFFNRFYQVKRPGEKPDQIPGEEIVHLKGLSLDGLRGVGPIEYAREMLGLAIAAETHGATLFKQGARLGGVLSHPGLLTKEAAERLKATFEETYASVENAHRTAVLEEGMKFERVAMTAEDSQFLETRNYQRSEIAGFFRIPAHMINDLAHATFSNVEHLDIQFVRHSLGPWLTNIEQALGRDLLTEQDRVDHYFKLSADALLRGDTAARTAAYNAAIMAGWLSRNEVRELEDRNPYPGGDDFLIPANMQPAAEDREGTAQNAI